MTAAETISWQAIRAELMRRITEREWRPGETVPNEVDLAAEFGCARATVNRAMREIAEAGFIERRRKAGTRVALHPVRKATLEIPVIRIDLESRGIAWNHELIECKIAPLPAAVAEPMQLDKGTRLLHVRALHRADGKPYLYEDRWINSTLIPEVMEADLATVSANEWLVANALFSSGTLALSAVNAEVREAEALGTEPGTALFCAERITWQGEQPITWVRMFYAPGYAMQMTL